MPSDPKYPLELDADERGERWRVRGNQLMAGVHLRSECSGSCVLHAPTAHHMRGWPLYWRADRHMFERICPHGVGHPDPDEDRIEAAGGGVHGCDGCCQEVMSGA